MTTQNDTFKDPLSEILFHTDINLDKYHFELVGTGTSGFFSIGFYSTPLDLHESITRYLPLTLPYDYQPLELNERIEEIQRVLISSQRPVLFLIQFTQDTEYHEFLQFFEIQLLAQHHALSASDPNLQAQQHSSPAPLPSTTQGMGSPGVRKQNTVQITQKIYNDLQLLLRSFPQPRDNYFKGDRILFFQNDSSLRIESDCTSPLISAASTTTPIASDNILCQHLRSIFIVNGVYPFDQNIEDLYCKSPNLIPQPTLQRLPLVLLHSLMKNSVSITQQQQQQQQLGQRRPSFSVSRASSSQLSIPFTALTHLSNPNRFRTANSVSATISSSSSDDDTSDSSSSDDDALYPSPRPLSYNKAPSSQTIPSRLSPNLLPTQSKNNLQNDVEQDELTSLVNAVTSDNRGNPLVSLPIHHQGNDHPRTRTPSMQCANIDLTGFLPSQNNAADNPSQNSLYQSQIFSAPLLAPSSSPKSISSQLVLPFFEQNSVLRSSYVYLEKTNMFGFTKWKRRYVSIKGNQFTCSHHHLMAPTISFNLQTCKIYVEDDLRLVDLDALPALNSPNSFLYKSLNIDPSQRVPIGPSQDSSTAFFSALLERHITGPKSKTEQYDASLGSHLTRVPENLCTKDSFHVIFVLVDQETSGYQIRISADPQLAKKWLRDLVVIATLSRLQSHLYKTLQPPYIIDFSYFPKILPFLAHYRRDPTLLQLLPTTSSQSSSLSLQLNDEFDDDDKNSPIQQDKPSYLHEILPPHILQMLQQKQREIVSLTMKSTHIEQTALGFKSTFESTKSQMYEYQPTTTLSKSKSTSKAETASIVTKLLQPTVLQQAISIPQKRQAGSSAKEYFNALELAKNPQKLAQLQAEQQAAAHAENNLQGQSHLQTTNTKQLNITEQAIAIAIFLLFLAYLIFYRGNNAQ